LDGSIVALLVTDPPENPSKDNPGQGPWRSSRAHL